MNTSDEDLAVVLQANGGSFGVDLKTIAHILKVANQTVYNNHKKWGFEPIAAVGVTRYRADDVASLLARRQSERKKRRGTSTKAERVAAQAAGLSVKEWRSGSSGGRE